MKTKILSLMLIVSSIFLFSCKEDDNFTDGKLKKTNLTLNVGESSQLEYTGMDCTFQSGNPLIASVTNDGMVTGVHVGKTNIRANWSSCEVEVKSKNNFYVDPIINGFDLYTNNLTSYFSSSQVSYSKNGKLSYISNAEPFELNKSLKDKFNIYDANVNDPSDASKTINVNFYTELSPEKDNEVKDASLKSVLRYVYMYNKNSKKIEAIGLVTDYSNADFLYDYLCDRYMIVSDSETDKKEFKSIDDNLFIQTDFIDERGRDENYNYTTFVEKAFAIAMIVPNGADKETLITELKNGIIESYLRKSYTVTLLTSENGIASAKNIKGKELTEGKMIQYGKVILSATANPDYKFAGWGVEKDGKVSVTSYQRIDTITIVDNIKYIPLFEKPFNIKVSATEGGTANISSATESNKETLNVTKYDEIIFKAEPVEGYQFKNWTDADGNEISKSATYKATFTEEVEYIANFEVAKYNITVKLEGEGIIAGEIVEGDTKTPMEFAESTLKGVVKYGQEVKVTATENETSDYIFAGWQCGKKIVSTEKNYSFTATQDSVFTALFQKKQFKVTVEAGEGGTVTPTTKNVEVGSLLKIEAKPKKGYKFDKWVSKEGELISTENPYEPTITEESYFKALFSKMNYDVTVSVKGEGEISAFVVEDAVESAMQIGESTSITYGKTIKLKVTNINESSLFVGWQLGDKIVSKDIEFVTTVSDNSVYTALFEKKAYYIKISASEGGEIVGNDHPRVEYGNTLTLTANAKVGYVLVNWTANGNVITDADNNIITSTTFTTEPIYQNINYQANFEKIKYEVKVEAGEGGTVTPATNEDNKLMITAGEQTTIQATPNEGYKFVNWTVGGVEVSTSNPYTTAPIDKEKTYQANFEKI